MAFPTTNGEPGGRRRGHGFTLIELLVVFAILATLLTLAVPRYFSSVERSKEAVLKQNLSTLRSAIDQFHHDTGKYPERFEELVEKHRASSDPAKAKAAQALAAKLEEVLGGADHAWYVGKMDPAEAARRKQAAVEFQKRYEDAK